MGYIQGHAIVHLLSPVNVSSNSPHIYLELVIAALLVVGHRGGCSYRIFNPAFWRGWHPPIGFFSRYIPHTLDFRRKLESSVSFLRVPF